MGVFTTSPASCLHQQTINDADLPCPGPHAPDLGSVWKWGGALMGRARQACQRTTLDDYSPALKTHDWGWGRVSGSTPGKSINLNPLPRGRACGRAHAWPEKQPARTCVLGHSQLCHIIQGANKGGEKGVLGGRRKECECRGLGRWDWVPMDPWG